MNVESTLHRIFYTSINVYSDLIRYVLISLPQFVNEVSEIQGAYLMVTWLEKKRPVLFVCFFVLYDCCFIIAYWSLIHNYVNGD